MPTDKVEQVMQILRSKGPVLPIDVGKEIKYDTTYAGAILSQLASEKKAMISHAKIGGSPVYYVRGQESKLQNLYKYLNEKDRQTFDALKQRGILKDTEQSPLVRVSLRNIKDFAVPLEVKTQEKTEIFWKWYLLSDAQATELITPLIKSEEPKPVVQPKKEEPVKIQVIQRAEPQKPAQQIKSITDFVKKEVQTEIREPEQKREVKAEAEIKDDFLDRIRKFFKEKSISIEDTKIIKKKSEIDLILRVLSSVGTLEYYCKAKNKKKITDSDLSSAYVRGQLKKLPVIFLTTGQLTKKANEILNKDIKINLVRI